MVGLTIFGFGCMMLGICYLMKDWKATEEGKRIEPYVVLAIGLVMFALTAMNIAKTYSYDARLKLIKILECEAAVIIALVGFYACIIVDNKKKREMVCSRILQGKIVDYKTIVKTDIKNRKKIMYVPIYEYLQNGEPVRMKSEVCGTLESYRQIGRTVTLVINDVNGSIYCKEEWERQKKIGRYMMICGTIFLILRILF